MFLCDISCQQQPLLETGYECKNWSIIEEFIVVLLGEKIKNTHDVKTTIIHIQQYIIVVKPIHSLLLSKIK